MLLLISASFLSRVALDIVLEHCVFFFYLLRGLSPIPTMLIDPVMFNM